MNHTARHNASFTCRLVRLWSFFMPSAVHTRHVQSCRSCRAWFAAGEEFDRRLSRDARRIERPAPEGLEQLVMAGVRQHRTPARGRGHRGSHSRLFVLTGVCAAAAVVVAVRFVSFPSPDTIASHDAADEVVIAEAAAAVEALPAAIRRTVSSSASKLAEGNLLLAEIDSAYADARSALDFLALNFLPTDTTTAPRREDEAGLRERQG